MGHHYDDERDYSGGRHSSQVHVPQTAEELRRNYDQNLGSVSNVHLETDEQGNASIMGVSVPKNLKPVIEVGLDYLKPTLIDQSDKIFRNTSNLASRIPFTKAHSNKIGVVAENVFRWGIIGAKQIFDVVNASSKYSKERTELFNTFSPVMQATGSNSCNNEVFKTAFDDVHGDWVSDMKKMVADLPTLIPMVILGLQDQAIAVKKRATGAAHKADDITKTVEESINKKTAYATQQLEESQLIARKMEEAREAWIKKELDNKSTRIIDPHEAYARRPGVEKDEYIFSEAQRKLIEEGKPVLVDRAYLTKEFNENAPSARDVMRSLQERDEHGRRGYHNEDHPKDEAKDKTDKMLRWAIPGASILTQIFKANIEDSSEKRKKRIKAWKMIEHLKKEMETQCGKVNGRNGGKDYDECDRSFTSKPADDIRIAGLGNSEGDTISLKDYIVEVFQQHERDREPSRNFRDKNGKLIDPLKGTLLTNLQPAVDMIAEHIADGSLSPDCLYKLVGENKIIIHSKSGARTFAKEDQVKHILEKELLPVLSTREVIKMEEFMAKFADPALIQDTLKKNLDGMKGTEKALFASLFPDDILEQVGIRKKDIVALRKEAHQFSYDFVAASTIHFAAQNPETLKLLGVSEQEMLAISSLAEKIEAGDVKALKKAVDGRDKTAVDAIRTAGLLEQAKGGEQGKQYWTERVKEMGAAHQKLKENARKFTPDEDTRGGDRQSRHDGEKKWASDKKKTRRHDSDAESRWDEDRPDRDFSSRFDPERGRHSAKDRVRKGRDSSDDASDMRVL